MQWRRILLEWPARAVDLWFTAYRIVLTVATVIAVTVVVVMLVLALFGIRWGW